MYEITKKHLVPPYASAQKFYNNRQSYTAVMTHIDLGNKNGTDATLRGTKSASYHIYIPRENDHEIIEYVPFDKGAWHAGVLNNPTERAKKILGSEVVPNLECFAICYGGRGVDKNGRITGDWSKVVNGQPPTPSQIKRAAWVMETYGVEELPLIAHVETTDYKPSIVLQFNEEIRKTLEGVTCSLSQFSNSELFAEIMRRIRLKNS